MKLRVLPWLTPNCINFLNNLFKWLPASIVPAKLNVLEVGGGNSSLYFLSKGCKIVTIESDDNYIADLRNTATAAGFSVDICTANNQECFIEQSIADLIIIKATDISEIAKSVLLKNYDIFINDGISRHEFLEFYIENKMESMLILDNCEYCANCGYLSLSSAYPERIKSFRNFLRSSNYKHYLFEQIEGRDGHGIPDATGNEISGRWISAVAWPNDSKFAKQIVTDQGLPMVIKDGLDDSDISTVRQKNPYLPESSDKFISSHRNNRDYE